MVQKHFLSIELRQLPSRCKMVASLPQNQVWGRPRKLRPTAQWNRRQVWQQDRTSTEETLRKNSDYPTTHCRAEAGRNKAINMNATKVIAGTIITGAVVGLSWLASLLINDDQPEQQAEPQPAPEPPTPSTKPPVATDTATQPTTSGTVEARLQDSDYIPQAPKADEFPLRLGSKGPRVERLQIWLLRNYGNGNKVTGVFDQNTERRLQRYLQTKQLTQQQFEDY